MNRELSWLKFNERVLEEAENQEVPLCERMNFVSIYQSNLDEFFRVRVGSLQDQMLVNKKIRDNKTNMTSEEQIKAILKEVKRLNKRKDAAYADLMKKVAEYGITLVDFKTAKPEEKKFLEQYFNHEIVPLSSPTIVGKRQPFPFLRNQEIYAVVVLRRGAARKGSVLFHAPIIWWSAWSRSRAEREGISCPRISCSIISAKYLRGIRSLANR